MAKRVKVLTVKIENKDFYLKYLKVINGLLRVPLTHRELDVLNAVHLESNGFDALTLGIKRKISVSLSITRININNIVMGLKRKGALEKDVEDDLLVISKQFECPRMEKGDNLVLGMLFNIQWQQ